jgi:hypothetical protein
VLGHLRRQQLTQDASSLHNPAKERHQPVHELHERGPECSSASAEKPQLGCAGSYQHVSTNFLRTPSAETYTDILLLSCAFRHFWKRIPRTSNTERRDTTSNIAKGRRSLGKDYRNLDTGFLMGGFAPATSTRTVATRATTYTTAVLHPMRMHAVLGHPSSTSSALPSIPAIEHRTTLSALFQHVWGIGG